MRKRADRLFARGLSRAEVARQLGVSRSTASRWYRAWALGHTPRRGRPPRLSAADLARVERALGDRRWSLASSALLIERLTGVRYHRRHVGRLLRRMGWVIPPIGRAPVALRRRTLRDHPVALLERRAI